MADDKAKTLAEVRAELRLENLAPVRATENALALRDSSLKKNTSFVRKIKTYSEAQQTSVLNDIRSLNLSKYISEICQAIIESKFKLSDVPSLVQVCSRLHVEYADFSSSLLDFVQKSIPSQAANPAKARVDLRLTAELLLAGVFSLKEGYQLLKHFLQEICNQSQQSLSAVISFCKSCGDELLALNPGAPADIYVPIDKQKLLQMTVREYFKSICRHATREHGELCKMQKKHRHTVQSKGVAPQDMAEKLENAQAQLLSLKEPAMEADQLFGDFCGFLVTFVKLTTSLEQLALMLGESAPHFCEPEEPPEGEGVVRGVLIETELAEESLWEDSDTQAFYEHLPDLKAIMPAIPKENAKDDKEYDELGREEEKSVSPSPDAAGGDTEAEEDLAAKAEKEMKKVETKPQLDLFLKQLPQCFNRDTIDQMAEQFCFNLNTRPNRYKLTRALFLVSRTRLDLLPLYSRLTAILKPVAADLGDELCGLLLKDFAYQLRKKDQMNIETKARLVWVKTVRFLAELTKFRVLPMSTTLRCLKKLLADFSHHAIDMSCHLVESCGRFLFLQPESHGPMRALVDQMLRKRMVQNLDARHQLMVDNACAVVTSIAAPRQPPRAVQRTPVERYVRKLLYQDLCKTTVEKVVRQLRKLDWSPDSEHFHMAIRLLSNAHEVRYFNIRFLAHAVATLATYLDGVGPRVVDAVLEDIRLGMEINDPKYNQRRVAAVHYLGELYNYSLIESALIFSVLYSLIMFGAGTPLDPPENVFRLKLVCCLLDTCAIYFDTGGAKRRLDSYLHFVLLYFWQKREDFGEGFPVTVELHLRESIQPLRPKFQWPKSLEAAQAAVDRLLSQAIIAKAEKDATAKVTSSDIPASGQTGQANEDDGGALASPGSADATGAGYDSEGLSDNGDGDEDDEGDEDDDDDDDDDEDVDETESEEPEKEPEPDEFQREFEAEFEEMVYESMAQRSQDRSQQPQVKEIMVPHLSSQQVLKPTAVSQLALGGNPPPGLLSLAGSGALPGAGHAPANVNDVSHSNSNHSNNGPITGSLGSSDGGAGSGATNFVIMMRSQNNRNKPLLKSIHLEDSDELAKKIALTQKREREEKQRMKQLTLNMNMRQEEESWNDDAPDGHLIGPERKFVHPRGAPDADLIFGSSSRRR
ncbi:regulator of nonsense transcripts 2-like [Tropilaelaps mercedesae]|uniref:Regulator of nonsense transcripts 2-like n=1 Tax=Tropilaelaps mercedesae TaxID=418985 RepID=A0A1V9XTR4_9ACAR|nr:regulator of nonsense transcripts 2-like [Tropilaelaps mercedesae]